MACADGTSGIVSATPCNLIFPLQPKPKIDSYFEARTVRLMGSDLGVRFVRSSEPDMQRLKAFLQRQTVIQAKVPTPPIAPLSLSRDGARRILQQISQRHLSDIVEYLQEVMLNRLWKTSEQAASDTERSRITGDIALLGLAIRDGRYQTLMRRGLFDPIVSLGTVEPNQQRMDELSDLELVEQNRFDVWLAVSAMTNRLEQQLNPSLDKLQAQARELFGRDVQLPVEPQGIAYALETTLSQIGLQAASQSLCLQVAREELAHRLGEFYQELTQAWEAAGLSVTPNNPKGSISEPVSPKPNAPSTETPSVSQTTPDLTDVLLAANNHYEPGSGTSDLKQQVAQILHTMDGSQSGVLPARQMNERIDVTDRMLSNMLNDPWVPANIKDLIKHLSMQLMAQSVHEPTFFRDASHPLMGLIDQLEHLSMLAPESTELNGLVQQAMDTDARDLDHLSTIMGQLDALAKRHAGAYQRNAERLVARHEGKERLHEAREQVRNRLNRSFAGHSMHRAVLELIEQAWRALLELVHLRKGGKSALWRSYWQVLLSVHRLSGGHQTGNTELPKKGDTLDQIRDGLSYIGFDPFRRGKLLDGLQKALDSSRADNQHPDDFTIFTEIPAKNGGDKQTPPPDGMPASDWEQALTQVDSMSIGSVLRFGRDGQEQIRHLVWRNDSDGELVLVDPKNLDARPMSREKLARDILKDRVKIQPPQEQSATERATTATLEEMQARISYHETHDSLTGLSNRRHLVGLLTSLLMQEPASFDQSMLGIMDIDHFDALTGRCGYQAGERMLVAMAKLLENTLENASCIAYLGGSRFAFIQPLMDAGSIRVHGENLRAAIANLPFVWDGKPYPVVGSLGLIMVTVECDNPETLLSAADSACSAARRAGGDRTVVFHEEDEIIALQRQAVDGWLKAEEVVRSRRMRLRGQRIADTDPGRDNNHHYEILLSVFDDQEASMPLEEFIGAAEAFNLMADMDRLVMEHAFQWMHEQPRAAARLGGIAINLSGQSLCDEGLVERVRGYLNNLKLDPQLISFEVTETAAIANLDQAVAIIEGIRALGCRFALDDFGTGLSSYSYLKRMPVDYLKIDGSFIKDMLKTPDDTAIVKSINEIAHFMGKETIAEYVENAEIRKRLQDIGVDYVQGYAVEKPLYLDEIKDQAP